MITRVGYGTSRTTCYKGHMKKQAYCNTCKRERAKLYYKNNQQKERDRKRLAARTKTNDERMRNGREPITYASQETTQEGRVRKNRLPVAINRKHFYHWNVSIRVLFCVNQLKTVGGHALPATITSVSLQGRYIPFPFQA